MEYDVFFYYRFFFDFLNFNIKLLCDFYKINFCDYVIFEIFLFFLYGFIFYYDQVCCFIGYLFIIYKYICISFKDIVVCKVLVNFVYIDEKKKKCVLLYIMEKLFNLWIFIFLYYGMYI